MSSPSIMRPRQGTHYITNHLEPISAMSVGTVHYFTSTDKYYGVFIAKVADKSDPGAVTGASLLQHDKRRGKRVANDKRS